MSEAKHRTNMMLWTGSEHRLLILHLSTPLKRGLE